MNQTVDALDVADAQAPPRALVGRRVHRVPGRDAAAAARQPHPRRGLRRGAGRGGHRAAADVAGAAVRRGSGPVQGGRGQAGHRVSQPAGQLRGGRRRPAALQGRHRSIRPSAWPCCSTCRRWPTRSPRFARVTAPADASSSSSPTTPRATPTARWPSGVRAFTAAARFFAALAAARGEATDPSIGPKVATMLAGARHRAAGRASVPGIARAAGLRRATRYGPRGALPSRQALSSSPTPRGARQRRRPISTHSTRIETSRARPAERCVEIQHTTLFATVGQKSS